MRAARSQGKLCPVVLRVEILLTILMVGIWCACEPIAEERPDEFPGRLKKGCSSEKECARLVSDARDRWGQCREQHLVGGVRHSRCSNECADFMVARDKALAWLAFARPGSVDPAKEDPTLWPRCL